MASRMWWVNHSDAVSTVVRTVFVRGTGTQGPHAESGCRAPHGAAQNQARGAGALVPEPRGGARHRALRLAAVVARRLLLPPRRRLLRRRSEAVPAASPPAPPCSILYFSFSVSVWKEVTVSASLCVVARGAQGPRVPAREGMNTCPTAGWCGGETPART